MEARVIFVIMGTSPYEDPPPAKLRASKGGDDLSRIVRLESTSHVLPAPHVDG